MNTTNLHAYIEAFDQTFQNRGGRFEINRLGESDLQLFQEILKIGQYLIDRLSQSKDDAFHPMPYVHLDIIDNLNFNAVAAFNDGKEFIGINSGTVLLLQDIFDRILSTKEAFYDIGLPDQEVNPRPLHSFSFNYLKFIQDIDFAGFPIKAISLNEDRKSYAKRLTTYAVMFLVNHELAHLRFGHVHFLSTITRSNFILEYNNIHNEYRIDSLTNKVLEWDADRFATLCFSSFYMTDCISILRQANKDDEFITGLESLFGHIFSIFILFIYMDIVRKESNSELSYYPKPRERLFYMIISTISSIYNECDTPSVDLFIRCLFKSFKDAVRIMNLIGPFTYSIDDFLDSLRVFIDESEKVYFNLYEHWESNVKSLLSPFTRAKLT